MQSKRLISKNPENKKNNPYRFLIIILNIRFKEGFLEK
jgi:hypothetical protein